MLLPTARMN